MKRSLPPNTQGLRLGFSLIEVLIALALTVLLLSAVYAAVGLHLRFQVAGRDQINRAQLMRAVIQKMETDLGGLAFVIEEETSTEEETTTTSTTDTSLTALSTEETPTPYGLVGTAELLHLCVNKPIRELTYDSLYLGEVVSGRTTELTTISWGTGPVDPLLLIDPTEPIHNNSVSSSLDRRPQTGLARRFLDFYAFDAATDELTETDLIAPEITEVQFQYFDGSTWADTWDSRANGVLPRAIKVTFGFWQPAPEGSRTQDGTVFPVEHLFYVPMSIPIVE